jgi:hypothetical protein
MALVSVPLSAPIAWSELNVTVPLFVRFGVSVIDAPDCAVSNAPLATVTPVLARLPPVWIVADPPLIASVGLESVPPLCTVKVPLVTLEVVVLRFPPDVTVTVPGLVLVGLYMGVYFAIWSWIAGLARPRPPSHRRCVNCSG